jgi:hypothetical protein
MNTTKVSPSAIRNHVAATIERDGVRVGHVVRRGVTFAASRKTGSVNDVRIFAANFRSLTSAVKWVEAAA